MRNLKFFFTLLMSVSVLFFTSCEDDKKNEDKGKLVKPVYGEHFTVTVDGNNVTLACTMEAATAVIWAVNDKEYTQKTEIVPIPLAGTYSVVLSVSSDGLTYIDSDPYEFEVETTDTSFLESGFWKDLTGGPEGGKVWILDLKKEYFHAIADYYGDNEAGAIGEDAWGPWGGGYVSEEDLGGEISFNGITGTVTLKFDGETKTGQFSLDVKTRPAAEDYMTYGTDKKFDLWEDGFKNGPYKYLELSDEIATVKFAEGLHFPLDKDRFYNEDNEVFKSQFLPEDIETCDIVHISDNALVLRVKRTYEGDKENKCWMLYNYIVKGYEYEKVIPEVPVVEGYQAADLVGTWKVAPATTVAWIGWEENNIFDTWATREEYIATMISWWQFGNPEETEVVERISAGKSAAADKVELEFKADGTATIKNVEYDADADAETEEVFNVTYTVNNGILTFDKEVSINGIVKTFVNAELQILQPVNGEAGIWLGVVNGDEYNSTSLNIVKQ